MDDAKPGERRAGRYDCTDRGSGLPHFLSDARKKQLGPAAEDALTCLNATGSPSTRRTSAPTTRSRCANQLQAQACEPHVAAAGPASTSFYGIAARGRLHGRRRDPGRGPRNDPAQRPGAAAARGRRFSSSTCWRSSTACFASLYPKHPDFDMAGTRPGAGPRPTCATSTAGSARRWESPIRRVQLESGQLALGPAGWCTRSNWARVSDGPAGRRPRLAPPDRPVRPSSTGSPVTIRSRDVRRWIGELGWPGLDRGVGKPCLIATYALLADRSWLLGRQSRGGAGAGQDRPRGWGAARPRSCRPRPSSSVLGNRAGALFGAPRPPNRCSPRNLQNLHAKVVRGPVRERTGRPCTACSKSCAGHAADLGIRPDSPRLLAVTVAAELLDRLAGRADTDRAGARASAGRRRTRQRTRCWPARSPRRRSRRPPLRRMEWQRLEIGAAG